MVPIEVETDETERTALVPYETIAEASREAHRRLFPIETLNVELEVA